MATSYSPGQEVLIFSQHEGECKSHRGVVLTVGPRKSGVNLKGDVVRVQVGEVILPFPVETGQLSDHCWLGSKD